ncbi:PrsW family intramembrane metalloprotease [Kineococcus sp. SYSU DK005]|uniref:PrsW family intramembrane metalloprotease n=1 Tax=Kineococcus sp. SYSU DK005 TaxID=3383126 RepID=UPI003D7E7289
MSTIDLEQPARVRGPVGVDGFVQPRRAAFWLLVVFLVNGAFIVGPLFYDGWRVVPTTIVLGLLVWGAYTAIPLLFFRWLDLFAQHPPLGFALAFAWGGLGALYLAVPANTAIISALSKTRGPTWPWIAAIAGPSTEELLKVLGVVLLVLIARTQFRTILSVVVIGAVVGLGFQVIEDLDYTLNTALSADSANQVVPVLSMLFGRGVLSGLWSHTLFTSVAAFGVGYVVARPRVALARRLAVAIGCFALAWSFHFLWNSPLLLGAWWTIPLRGVPLLAVGALLWRLAGREEASTLSVLAEHYVHDSQVLTDDERAALASLRRRRALRRAVRRQHGRRAARLYHRLQRAQLHAVMVHGQYGAGERAQQAELEVKLLRSRYRTTTTRGRVVSA